MACKADCFPLQSNLDISISIFIHPELIDPIADFPRSMKSKIIYFFLIATFFAFCATAQDIEYIEDEGISLWEEEGFIDSTGEEPEFNTEDGQYISEEEVKVREEAILRERGSGLDIAAALDKEKKALPDNILYGVGTGVVIGGWFALWRGDNARRNVQYISLGVTGGVLLGVLVGTKSLYKSAMYRQREEFDDPFRVPFVQPPVYTADAIALLDYQYRF